MSLLWKLANTIQDTCQLYKSTRKKYTIKFLGRNSGQFWQLYNSTRFRPCLYFGNWPTLSRKLANSKTLQEKKDTIKFFGRNSVQFWQLYNSTRFRPCLNFGNLPTLSRKLANSTTLQEKTHTIKTLLINFTREQ